MATDTLEPPPGFELDAPSPPEGFELDAPSPPPGFELDSATPQPPDGFTLDAPDPPSGFVLDSQQPLMVPRLDPFKVSGQVKTTQEAQLDQLSRPDGFGWVTQPAANLANKFSAQTVQDAMDYAYGNIMEGSIVSTPEQKERGRELIGGPSRPPSEPAKAIAGAQTVAADTVNTMTSPPGVATLGMGVFSKPIQRIIATGFAAHMTKGAAEQAGQIAGAGLPEGTQEKVEQVGGLLVNTIMAAALAKHGAKPGEHLTPEKEKLVLDDLNSIADELEGQSKAQSISGEQATVPADVTPLGVQRPASPVPEKPLATIGDIAGGKLDELGAQLKAKEAPAPEVKPPEGDRMVTIQREDGTTYKAAFGDKYWEFGDNKIPSIAKLTPEGKWSHGMLSKGEKLVEGGINEDVAQGPSFGAATIGENLSPEGQLPRLTSTIEAQLKGVESPAERIKIADRLSDKMSAGKDAISAGVEKLKAGYTALRDAYMNPPKWTEFKKSLGEWQAADQETSFNVRKWAKTVEKRIPDKNRREAITNWIQADGNETVLQERADASKPEFKRGYEMALKLTPEEKVAARNIQQYLEARLQEGIDSGILKSGIENYVNQVWKKQNPVSNKVVSDIGTGTLRPDFKFAKKRVFESYFEGEQAGYKPASKDIGALMGVYDQAFNRSLSARAFIKQLWEAKTPEGEPLAKLEGTAAKAIPESGQPEAFLLKPGAMPKDAVTVDGRPYMHIDHHALRGWKFAAKGEGGAPVLMQADMLVHPDFYTHLDRVLRNTSPFRENVVGRALLHGATELKQTKLSLSPFHMVQEGIHATFHRVNPFKVYEINFKDPIQRELIDHGLNVSDSHAMQLFQEGMTGGGLVRFVPGVGKIQMAFNDWLFREYIPGLKVQMATEAFERNLHRYEKDLQDGKISRDQVAEITAKQGNAAFGELNYKMMGRSPFLQDLFRITALAPDFLEARMKFVGQALKPYGGEQRAALLLMAGTVYVAARILNQLFDNDPHWLDHPFEVIAKGRVYKLRTIAGDVEHLMEEPRRFAYNRLSPFSRTAIEAATGRDDRGIKRTSVEQLQDFLSWFKPIPVDIREDQTVAQTIASSAGLGSSKYTAEMQVQKLAGEFNKSSKSPKIQHEVERREKEVYGDSDYRKLKIALFMGNQKSAVEEYKALLKFKKSHDVREYFNDLINRPFTGSRQQESLFLKSLDQRQRQLYQDAKKERIELRKKFTEMRQKAVQ